MRALYAGVAMRVGKQIAAFLKPGEDDMQTAENWHAILTDQPTNHDSTSRGLGYLAAHPELVPGLVVTSEGRGPNGSRLWRAERLESEPSPPAPTLAPVNGRPQCCASHRAGVPKEFACDWTGYAQ